MSFLESVIQRTKKMEGLLEERYQAAGKGLHEKTTSVKHQLDAPVVKQLRFIASVRNKLMHEDGYNYDCGDEGRFLAVCDEVINYLFEHQRIIRKSYDASPQSPIPIFTEPPDTRLDNETSPVNCCETNAAKPKITRFKQFLMILGGLWLFGFILTLVLNGVFFVIDTVGEFKQCCNLNSKF